MRREEPKEEAEEKERRYEPPKRGVEDDRRKRKCGTPREGEAPGLGVRDIWKAQADTQKEDKSMKKTEAEEKQELERALEEEEPHRGFEGCDTEKGSKEAPGEFDGHKLLDRGSDISEEGKEKVAGKRGKESDDKNGCLRGESGARWRWQSSSTGHSL